MEISGEKILLKLITTHSKFVFVFSFKILCIHLLNRYTELIDAHISWVTWARLK